MTILSSRTDQTINHQVASASAIILARSQAGSLMTRTILSSRPDPVIEAYKKDLDRTLLRENLRLTP
jgi:hypothetical protein